MNMDLKKSISLASLKNSSSSGIGMGRYSSFPGGVRSISWLMNCPQVTKPNVKFFELFGPFPFRAPTKLLMTLGLGRYPTGSDTPSA